MLYQESDFIPKYHQRALAAELGEVKWGFNPNISGVPDDLDPDIGGHRLAKDQSGFYCNIFSTDREPNNDLIMGLCLPIVEQVCEYLPERVRLARIAGRLLLPGSGGINMPHIDYSEKNYTVVYYVNDSDGDTIFFNQEWTEENSDYPDWFDVRESSSPEAGKVAIFSGNIYHASSPPVRSKTRMVINMNLMVVD